MHAAARQSFREQEALVYQQLAQLIRDGVWLKSYLAAVMRLEQEAFQVHCLAHHYCRLYKAPSTCRASDVR